MLVEALIHQTENADTERELRKLGYSVEDIVPNDNFFVSEEGITYVYMPYEIAPMPLVVPTFFSLGQYSILY